MHKFKFYFLITLASFFVLSSCNKSDDAEVIPLHDYGEQYTYDLSVIESYLSSHYIKSITDHPGFVDDQDIELESITDTSTQTPISSDPRLHFITVTKNDIPYKVYYISQREGDATAGVNPTKVDEVLVSYDGSYLSLGEEPTQFEYVQYPSGFIGLDVVISGWSEIIPLFKSGTFDAPDLANPGQPTVFRNFGAGVMFLPSGLAYFNSATATVPSYAQLMFKFKLYQVKRADQDGDGILSIDEDLNHDGDFTNDDTDGDGIQDYLDADDDGDGYYTKNEIKDTNGNAILFDNIPSCNGDVTTPTRLKKYLDPSCH